MQVHKLNDDFSVAGQISGGDIADIANAGFKSIVCNRPDTEFGAVPHDQVRLEAERIGMQFRFVPVVSGQITEQNVQDMGVALKDLPRPVLLYCRSGARSANLLNYVYHFGLI